MFDITIPLDPVAQTGLTVHAKLYLPVGSVMVLVATIDLTETPASSAVYTNTSNITELDAGVYVVTAVDVDTGTAVGTGTLNWNGSAALAPQASVDMTQFFAAVVDGSLTLQQVFTALASFMNGALSVVNNGDGTLTLTFKKRNNSSTAFTVTFNNTTFVRASAGTNA